MLLRKELRILQEGTVSRIRELRSQREMRGAPQRTVVRGSEEPLKGAGGHTQPECQVHLRSCQVLLGT